MSRNTDHWERRFLRITQDRIRDERALAREITRMHQRSLQNISKELERFFERYAKNDNITLAKARQMLSRADQQSWSMSLREFRQKAKEGGHSQHLNREYYRSRVSRLQQLETQINKELFELASGEERLLKKHLTGVIDETFHRSAYEVERGTGVATNFAKLDTRAINSILNTSFHRSNFSQRVWGNKTRVLSKRLKDTLSTGLSQGHSVNKMSKALSDEMGIARNRAVTLLQTESAQIASQATLKAFEETGVEEFMLSAKLEVNTCKRCWELDGKVFKVKKAKIGTNASPLHPNCRCTEIPYYPDMQRNRRARDPISGEMKNIGNITYRQWRVQLDKQHGTGRIDTEIKKHQNRVSDKKQHRELRNLLGRGVVPRTFADFQELKYLQPDEWERLKQQARGARVGR